MKSIFKKIGSTLGSLLLSFNIGCNSLSFQNSDYQERQNLESVCLDAKPKSKKPQRPKMLQYPVNVLGGFFTHIFAHEGGHALAALAQGAEVTEFHPYPGFVNGELYGGWYNCDGSNLSSQQKAFINIAGPAADVALAEIINYNLRHGKISPKYQPFWATTSLMARSGPIWVAVNALRGQRGNDFRSFERNSGVSKETIAGLVGLYTALNAKRIVKEFKVALGRDTYHVNDTKSRVDLVPINNGISVNYSLRF